MSTWARGQLIPCNRYVEFSRVVTLCIVVQLSCLSSILVDEGSKEKDVPAMHSPSLVFDVCAWLFQSPDPPLLPCSHMKSNTLSSRRDKQLHERATLKVEGAKNIREDL